MNQLIHTSRSETLRFFEIEYTGKRSYSDDSWGVVTEIVAARNEDEAITKWICVGHDRDDIARVTEVFGYDNRRQADIY